MKLWETLLTILAFISLLIPLLVKTIGAAPVASKDLITNGAVTRIAHPGAVFLGEPVDVEVRIDASKLPPCQTVQPPPPPIYVALVIDRSGSMDRERKIEEARNSALEFVDLMDLAEDGGKVSVIAFNEKADVLRKFSYNRRAVRLAISSIKAKGNTNIADGLNKAGQQFDSISLPADATSIVILLSDGISDPASAIQAAEQLKSRGLRVISVGLGSDADQDTLRRIASSDGDYYRAASAASLLDIYDEIASGMVGTVATDVTLVEYFNNKHFRLIGETYRGVQNDNQIVWQIPFVGRLGRSASYFLLPIKLGWHPVTPVPDQFDSAQGGDDSDTGRQPQPQPVSSEPGRLELTDCNGQPFSQNTPEGPGVLVLPPVWLFYLFPFLVLLIRLYLWLTQKEPPRIREIERREPPPRREIIEKKEPGDIHEWYAEETVADKTGHPLTIRIGGAKTDTIRLALRNNSSASVRLFVEEGETHLGSTVFSLAAREETDPVTRKRSIRRETIIRQFDVSPENQKRGVAGLLLEKVEAMSREHKIDEIRYPNPGNAQEFFINQGYRHRKNDEGYPEVFKELPS